MSKFNSFKKFNKDIDLLKGFKGNDICGKISEKFQDNTNISYVKFFPDNDSYAMTGLSELRLSFQSNNKTTDVFHPDDIIKLRLTEDPNEYTTPNGDRYLSLDFCFKNGTVFKKINDTFEPIGSSKELNTYFLTFPRKNDIGDPVMYITVEGCCNKNLDGKSVVFEDLRFVKSNEKMLGSLADYGIKSIHIINDYTNNKWPDSFIDGNVYSICLAGICQQFHDRIPGGIYIRYNQTTKSKLTIYDDKRQKLLPVSPAFVIEQEPFKTRLEPSDFKPEPSVTLQKLKEFQKKTEIIPETVKTKSVDDLLNLYGNVKSLKETIIKNSFNSTLKKIAKEQSKNFRSIIDNKKYNNIDSVYEEYFKQYTELKSRFDNEVAGTPEPDNLTIDNIQTNNVPDTAESVQSLTAVQQELPPVPSDNPEKDVQNDSISSNTNINPESGNDTLQSDHQQPNELNDKDIDYSLLPDNSDNDKLSEEPDFSDETGIAEMETGTEKETGTASPIENLLLQTDSVLDESEWMDDEELALAIEKKIAESPSELKTSSINDKLRFHGNLKSINNAIIKNAVRSIINKNAESSIKSIKPFQDDKKYGNIDSVFNEFIQKDIEIDLSRNETEEPEDETKAEERRLKREEEEKERERLKNELEEKARLEAKEKARRKAEKEARKEAERDARRAAEEKARLETEERIRRESLEKARLEAEREAKREALEKARKEAREKANYDILSAANVSLLKNYGFTENLEQKIPVHSKFRTSTSQTSSTSRNKYLSNKYYSDVIKDLAFYIQVQFYKNGRREFSIMDIINLLLCISQGYITIFAGKPGVGKSSCVSLLAKTLGLCNKFVTRENGVDCEWSFPRYTEVNVAKNWSSSHDFIGYWNTFNKSFDGTNVYQAIKDMQNDPDNLPEKLGDYDRFPYWILLDEANLSPIEEYWSDFMNKCDIDQYHSVNLTISPKTGESDYQLKLPNTLRFLATINYDHTTQNLSERILDRSWVITLTPNTTRASIIKRFANPSPGNKIITNDIFDYLLHFMDDFYNNDPDPEKHEEETCAFLFDFLLGKENSLPKDDEQELSSNDGLLRLLGLTLSQRVWNAIRRYCYTAKKLELFKDPQNQAENHENDIILDYIVSQRILPRMRLAASENDTILDLIKEKLNQNMPISRSLLKKIEENGKDIGYYSFFNQF